MMNKKRTKRIERAKYLLFLPLATLLLMVSNIEAIARNAKKTAQSPEALLENKSSTMPADTTVFDVVEQMPQYPGGVNALMNFLSNNIKYPERAAKNKVQGRVIVMYVVDQEGNVTNTQVIRSVSPELDEEALRVVKAMPKWIPGIQHGKKVSVKYTLPIAFRLPETKTAR